MNIFNRFRKPLEEKVSRAYAVVMQGDMQPTWRTTNYEAYCREGYTQNVVVHQAINKIASAVSSVKWVVQKPSGDFADKSPLLDLLTAPNPMQSASEWWRDRIGYLLLSGNNYEE